MNERKELLYDHLMQLLDRSVEMDDKEIYSQIDSLLVSESHENYISLSDRRELRNYLFNRVRRLDLLQELLDDDEITEIMVNGTSGIYIEKNGRIFPWHRSFETSEKLEDLIQQIVAYSNRTANEANAIVDARLKNGERISIVMKPVAIDGPVITIRRFPQMPIDMDRLIEIGSITEEAAMFLRSLVISGYNIFISGGTGS